MIIRSLILLISMYLVGAGCISTTPEKNVARLTSENSAGKPNVIIIFTDDQGYGDLGCNLTGEKPNLVTELTRRMQELDAEIEKNARAPWHAKQERPNG